MSIAAGARHAECLRALAFSDPEGELWGAAWIPPGSDAVAVVSVGAEAESVSATLEGEGPGEAWRLHIGDGELIAEGLVEPVMEPADADPDFDQLCSVTGTVAVGGERREVDCLGWRAARSSPSLGRPDVGSVRQIAAWFGPDDGFALMALRPVAAKGQDQDIVSAVMFAASEPGAVSDPRLSTTYAETGEPLRAGVELWIQDGDDPDRQFPRRAIGEATHAPIRWTVDGLALEAQPFHWHAGGRDGPGIYLLGRRA